MSLGGKSQDPQPHKGGYADLEQDFPCLKGGCGPALFVHPYGGEGINDGSGEEGKRQFHDQSDCGCDTCHDCPPVKIPREFIPFGMGWGDVAAIAFLLGVGVGCLLSAGVLAFGAF